MHDIDINNVCLDQDFAKEYKNLMSKLVKRYNTSNISQILSDNIKDICGSNGDITGGMDFGVNRYDGNWYSYTTTNSDLISNQIKSIDEDLTSGFNLV